MPRGDKSKYTDKQKRQAEHIEEGYEERGVGSKDGGGVSGPAWAGVRPTDARHPGPSRGGPRRS